MSNESFGFKIGIEGEKEFKKALSDINQSFKVLGSEMALVSSQFDRNDKSVEALAARNEVLNKELDAQRGKIETLRTALDNAATSFGENDRRTQNWKIQLNKAQAELNGLERELSDNENAIGDHAEATDQDSENMQKATQAASKLAGSVDDLGEEFDDSGKRALSFGDVLKANLLSAAIIGGIKSLGSAISEIGKAFVGALKDGVSYNAQLESYTTSFTTMLGDQAKAQQLVNDLKKEAAATPFAMTDLAQSAQVLMGFGMNAQDAQKHMKELGDISQGDSEKFKSLTLAFAQMSSTGKLTGQDLVQMINAGFNPLEEISRKTGKSIGELKEEMAKGAISADMVADAFASATAEGGRFYGAMEAQSKTFNGQVSTMLDGVSSLKGQIAQGLTNILASTALPMVNGWLGELSAAFEADGATGLIDTFGGVLQEAIGFISEQLPIVVELATQIIISLVQGITDALPQITQAAVLLLMTLVEGIVEVLPSLTSAAVLMVGTIVTGLADALPALIPAAVLAVVQIVQGLLDNLPMLLDAALGLISGLAQGLLIAIPQLVEALPAVITAIVDFLIGAIPQIIETGIQLLVSLVEELPTIITTIVAAIPQIINSIITNVLNAIPQMISAGIDLLVSLIEALPEIIVSVVSAIPQIVTALVGAVVGNIDKLILAGVQLFVALVANLPTILVEIVKAVPQIITGLVSAFSDHTNELTQVGGNLIKGLWKGISDAGAWLWDKISGFFDDIVDGIKDFFGIHSPSTLFAQLGGNMGLGIGVGFEKAMDTVARDMQNAIPTSFDYPSLSTATGSRNMAGSYGEGNTTINQSISVVSPKALSEKEMAREFKILSRKLALEY
ncbi:tape measure protein [Alkalibacter rhizosphaerae]|uniref:Tape measure protein n=1 Tax=Alkalibacter rhizosphaerae TaxID=2815577 RepID=A0A975AIW4_9FIRM|nr:tape measure protein [Alkalibacter rhizosphaerae]QSX09533.1 tape measure protein [Alkalibacter rhizosphaerae]